MEGRSSGRYWPFIEMLEKWLEEEDRKPAWLARRISVTANTVSRWINEGTRPDSPDSIVMIADVLNRMETDCVVALKGAGYYVTLNQLLEKPDTTELTRGAIDNIRKRSANLKAGPTPAPSPPPPDLPTSISEKTLASKEDTKKDLLPVDTIPPITPLPRLADMPLDHIPDIAHPPVHSRVRFDPNRFFVGREEELMQLAAWLKGEDAPSGGQVNTVAITGMGGIGKTQLAVEFVYRYGQFFQGGVFWLSCIDPAAIPIEMALCYEHLPKLDKDSASSESTNLVEKVKSIWQKPQPRLLIFDNCDEVKVLNEWRPKFGGLSGADYQPPS